MFQPTALRGLRTFVVIWFGQLVSSFGSGLTGFGLGVYLFERTGSAAQFALNSFLYVVPLGLTAFVAGALVDRWDRRRILIVADTGQALATLIVALLLYADRLAVWHIYTLTVASAVLRAFQAPAYEASVALLVPKRHLARAAGMAQVSRAVSDLVTPGLAGFLVLAIGLSNVVLIDLATFGVAIATLLIVRIPSPQAARELLVARGSLWQDIGLGWRYLRDRPGLWGLNLVSYVHDFFANAALVLTVPLVLSFAGADEAGIVLAAGGAGLLLGGLLMSAWGGPKQRVQLYLGAVAFDGIAIIVAGWSPHVLVVAAGRLLFWFGFAVGVACLRPIIQSKVAPVMQGRVFGVIGAISLLTEAPAYPVAGFLTDEVFEPLMMQQGALATLLGPLIGVGPGRGIGLLHLVLGICLVATAVIGWLIPRIRLVEDELPDMINETNRSEERDPATSRVASA